eukprot:2132431-Prymnesium_polylepis.1
MAEESTVPPRMQAEEGGGAAAAASEERVPEERVPEERVPVSNAARKKAWKAKMAACCGKAPFAYTCGDVTINLQVRHDMALVCTTLPCPNPDFGLSKFHRGEGDAEKHAQAHASTMARTTAREPQPSAGRNIMRQSFFSMKAASAAQLASPSVQLASAAHAPLQTPNNSGTATTSAHSAPASAGNAPASAGTASALAVLVGGFTPISKEAHDAAVQQKFEELTARPGYGHMHIAVSERT